MPEDLPLVVSELVTNSVVHGAAPIEFRLMLGPDGLAGEVCDHGHWPALVGTGVSVDPMVPGGHGLRIVAALTGAWGVREGVLARDPQCVWFHLPHTGG